MSDEGFNPWVRSQLLQRRVVLLRGALDDALAGQVTAELLFLEGSGDEPVVVHVDSEGGPLHAAFAVIDTIDQLRAPVEAVCVGRAEGSAVGVLAAAPLRHAATHARIRLSEPESSVSGRAGDLQAWAEQRQHELARFADRLAQASGRPFEHVEADLTAGRWLTAQQAVAYGLVDGIWEPGRGGGAGGQSGGGRPFGFGPSGRP